MISKNRIALSSSWSLSELVHFLTKRKWRVFRLGTLKNRLCSPSNALSSSLKHKKKMWSWTQSWGRFTTGSIMPNSSYSVRYSRLYWFFVVLIYFWDLSEHFLIRKRHDMFIFKKFLTKRSMQTNIGKEVLELRYQLCEKQIEFSLPFLQL